MQSMTATKTTILILSWLGISALGFVLLHSYWSTEGMPILAKTRPLVFIAIMGCIHFVGYCVFQNQHFGLRWFSILLAHEYKPALKTSGIQQFVTFLLSALMLDRGFTLHCWIISITSYWLIVAMITMRRPCMPTQLDVSIVRYGFIVIFIVIPFIALAVWQGLGLL